MRKRVLCLILAVVFLLGCLSACGKFNVDNDVDTSNDEQVVDESVDELEEPMVLNISDFLNQDGFVSAEKAYSKNRGAWHDMLGEPATTGVTYDGSYVAECYLYVSEDESWGQFLEFDYLADDIGGTDTRVVDSSVDELDPDAELPTFTIGADSTLVALPQLIRYVVFTDDVDSAAESELDADSEDNSEEELAIVSIAVLDEEHIMSGSMLTLNRQLFLKGIGSLIDRIGEPDNAEMVPWGYVSWDMDPVRFIVYLDGDLNILYGHRVPLWDETDASDDANSADSAVDASESSDSDDD